MKTILLKTAAVFGFVAMAGFALLVGIYPYRPESPGGWLLLLVVALPLLVLSERVSERLFESPRVARLSAPAPAAYGVVMIGVLLLAIAVALSSFSSSLGRW